jgi:hypothetical protein
MTDFPGDTCLARLNDLSGVEVTAMEFPGEHHMSPHGAMYSRALRVRFRRGHADRFPSASAWDA